MKRFLLLATAMLLTVSFAGAKESVETTNEVNQAIVAPAALPKVYSNCYDGYLNVRQAPTTQSQIVGKLKNGSEGAELLGVEGTWSKVRVNGVVGYVASKYLQSTPTEAVYIDASAVIGDWGCYHSYHTAIFKIKSNGKFEYTCYQGGDTTGSWYLSGYSLVLKYANGRTVTCEVNDSYLVIGDYAYNRE